MAEACLVRTEVTRVLKTSRSWASAAAPRSLARDFWREPRWSMAAAAMTPRSSETAFSPASFPGVNFSFSIGACLLRLLIYVCRGSFYTVDDRCCRGDGCGLKHEKARS